jgi:hypothetical protein
MRDEERLAAAPSIRLDVRQVRGGVQVRSSVRAGDVVTEKLGADTARRWH